MADGFVDIKANLGVGVEARMMDAVGGMGFETREFFLEHAHAAFQIVAGNSVAVQPTATVQIGQLIPLAH